MPTGTAAMEPAVPGATGARPAPNQTASQPLESPEAVRRPFQGVSGTAMATTACAAIPSLRPVKPSFSVVVALRPMRAGGRPVRSHRRRPMASIVRLQLRALANEGEVEIDQPAIGGGDQIEGMAQEPVGRRIPPLRIAVGKVPADIALAERAQNGVGQRVQGGIGIRMAFQSMAVVDPDAAQHNMVARLEGMNVEPLADNGCPGRHRPAGDTVGLGQVLGGRDLEIGVRTRAHDDREPGGFCNGRVVGQRPAGGGFMGLQDIVIAERLRCLGPPQPLARATVAVTVPSSPIFLTVSTIGTPATAAPWRCAASRQLSTIPGGHERAGRIVHQDKLRVSVFQEFQSVMDGFLACRSTGNQVDRFVAERVPGQRPVVRVNHCNNSRNRRMCSENADRPAQHRFPADPCILLRDAAAGARTAPGSDDHRGAGAALPRRWGIPVGSHGAAHITDPARFPSRAIRRTAGTPRCRRSRRGLG